MQIIIKNKAEIFDVPTFLVTKIRDRLTVENPAYVDAVKMNRWTGDLEEYLTFYEQISPGQLRVPRGFVNQFCFMAKKHGVPFTWKDETRELKPVDFQFKGNLRDYQETAVRDVLRRRFGVIQAPTGAGKTVIAISIIAERKQPALIIVHTTQLLNQWIDRLHAFLGIPVDEIGVLGGGKKRIGDRVTVGTVQTVVKITHDVAPKIAHLVIDECHRTPSRTFTDCVTAFDSRFMLGLSATPWRRDRLTKLIYWHVGDRVHEVDRVALHDAGHILKAKVTWRETQFEPENDPSEQYSRMLSELTQDPARNRMIAEDAAKEAQNGSGVLFVLSDRKEHAATLERMLNDFNITRTALLTGDTPQKQREKIVERLNNGEIKALCATGQLIGEGFDCKGLSTMFMATPIKFSGRVLQYLGRVLRPAPGKEMARVYDYRDVNVGPLVAAAKARSRTYQEAGAIQ